MKLMHKVTINHYANRINEKAYITKGLKFTMNPFNNNVVDEFGRKIVCSSGRQYFWIIGHTSNAQSQVIQVSVILITLA